MQMWKKMLKYKIFFFFIRPLALHFVHRENAEMSRKFGDQQERKCDISLHFPPLTTKLADSFGVLSMNEV